LPVGSLPPRPFATPAPANGPPAVAAIDHAHQQALADAAVGDRQPAHRPAPADGVEDGAAGDDEVGALRADARVVGALLPVGVGELGADPGDVVEIHGEAVDAGPGVPPKPKIDAGEGGHRP